MELLLPLVLIALSVFALIAGYFSLTEAVEGLGYIAIAGVLAVFLLVVQEYNHHREIKHLLGEDSHARSPNPPSKRELRRMLEEKREAESDS